MPPPQQRRWRLTRSLFARTYAIVVAALVIAFVLMAVSAGRRLWSGSPDGRFSESTVDAIAQHHERLTAGMSWVLAERLRAEPRERWPALVGEWQAHFQYPLSLAPASALLEKDLPRRTRAQLLAGEPSVWPQFAGNDVDRIILLLPLNGSDQVLVQELHLSPEPDLVVELLAPELAILFGVLGVAVLLVTRPLERRVGKLAKAAEAFGSGELTARAAPDGPEPLGDLARTFNSMAERIQRLTQEQQASLQTISHELRTPIGRLYFAFELARTTEDVRLLHDQLADMARDVGELEQLVEELLAYARLSPDAPPLEWESFDLVALVSDVLEQIAPFAPDLRPRFSAVGPLEASGSARHLRRAISNIARNAQRYARSTIAIDVQVDESRCLVVIDDDGPGIPVGDRDRLFLPFTPLDQDRNRQPGGHGLGLAIVHRVLQAHRGNAQIADSPLGGARFVLWWPAHAGKRASGYIR